MPLFKIQFSSASPRRWCVYNSYGHDKTFTSSLLKSSTLVEIVDGEDVE
jgi:hypothetical protein